MEQLGIFLHLGFDVPRDFYRLRNLEGERAQQLFLVKKPEGRFYKDKQSWLLTAMS